MTDATCVYCEEGDHPSKGGLKTYWATAELHGMTPGMWHDCCFWEQFDKKRAADD
jgi:hypothetical protein